MEKKKFYINTGSQEISQIKYDNNEDFVIYATEDEVGTLRQRMNHMHDADFRAFFRSHVYIKQYHDDKPNDDYDDSITEAFQIIYDLGDDTTKEHIDSMGILSDRHL